MNFEKLTNPTEAPKNKAEAVARFWGRALLNNESATEEARQAVLAGVAGFVATMTSDLEQALDNNPYLLDGSWGRSILMVNSQPTNALDITARNNGIPANAFPLKSSVYDEGQGIVFGHVGIDGPIEQIWPPVPAVEANVVSMEA